MTRARLAVVAVAVAAAVAGCSGDGPDDQSGTPGAGASAPAGTVVPGPTPPGGTAVPVPSGADAAAPLDPASFRSSFTRITVRGGSEAAVTQAVAEAEQVSAVPSSARVLYADGDVFQVDYGELPSPDLGPQIASMVSLRFPATASQVTGTGVAFTVTPAPGSQLGAGESALGGLDVLGLRGLTEERGGRDGVWRYVYRGEGLSAAQLTDLRAGIGNAAGVPEEDVVAEPL